MKRSESHLVKGMDEVFALYDVFLVNYILHEVCRSSACYKLLITEVLSLFLVHRKSFFKFAASLLQEFLNVLCLVGFDHFKEGCGTFESKGFHRYNIE